MTRKNQSDSVTLAWWNYLNGETLTPAGSSTQVSYPSETTIIVISAEGGAAYYNVNGDFAQSDSPGYVPEDGERVIGPLGNLSSLHVFAAAGVSVHLQYLRE